MSMIYNHRCAHMCDDRLTTFRHANLCAFLEATSVAHRAFTGPGIAVIIVSANIRCLFNETAFEEPL